ncbi:hypothetical protein [Sphingomonas panni]|uniref:hypothetical protein n=1 Tax=Sphingomonas panni TaxID=237612 RepID=UPI003019F9D2
MLTMSADKAAPWRNDVRIEMATMETAIPLNPDGRSKQPARIVGGPNVASISRYKGICKYGSPYF